MTDQKKEPISTYLIAGLGNPGKKYEYTRHNIGFLALDYIAKKLSAPFSLKKALKGQLSSCYLNPITRFILLKPETFMNDSGRSIVKTLKYYNVNINNLIVIHDDLDLNFKIIRSRLKGSAGGHNGLKSITENLNSSTFKRIKVGIINSHLEKIKSYKSRKGIVDFVLSSFNKDEIEYLDKYLNDIFNILIDFTNEAKPRTYKFVE